MYKIIGADGKEYGPISSEQLRQWLAEGRANAQTKVLPEGTTEWRTIGELPEFASTLPRPGAPGAMPVMQPVGVPAGDAAQRVGGPAIGLIVTAILGFLLNVVALVWRLAVGAAAAQPQGLSP